MDLNVSYPMRSAITRIMNSNMNTEFMMDVTFTSGQNSDFKFKPLYIETMNIYQHFTSSYTDKIVMTFNLSPLEYANLIKNSTELTAILTITYVDTQTGEKSYRNLPTVRRYRAMVRKPKDVYKEYTTGSIQKTSTSSLNEAQHGNRMTITVELMEYGCYNARQTNFCGIFTETDIRGMLMYVTKSLGIKNNYIVKPDNSIVYQHFTIPPTHDIGTVFQYFQETYGIYMKGCYSYITGDTFYIYPAYEHEPLIEDTLNIYNITKGIGTGARSFHLQSGKTIDVISNTKVKIVDLARYGAENVGTSISFLRSSAVIDGYATTDETGTFANDDVAMTLENKKSQTVVLNSSNDQYIGTTDNFCDASSRMAKWNGILISCGWKQAIPFILVPGHKVRYYYDKAGVFTKQKGILEAVEYTIQRAKQNAFGNTYACAATLHLHVDSDVS